MHGVLHIPGMYTDTCVLVLPCGRSAHTEAGWFAGRGLKTIVYMPEKQEPELDRKAVENFKTGTKGMALVLGIIAVGFMIAFGLAALLK